MGLNSAWWKGRWILFGFQWISMVGSGCNLQIFYRETGWFARTGNGLSGYWGKYFLFLRDCPN
jgi:hypothetical protein